jgi:hypothetical protein
MPSTGREVLLAPTFLSAQPGKKPNVVLIIADQLRYDCVVGKQDFYFTPGKGIKDIRHPVAKMVRTAR